MLATVAAEDVFDAAPELHRITAPTLLVAGGRDRFYTRSCSARLPTASPAPAWPCTRTRATPA
jgi:pimeloyl-ACP methyl ester carboxylesterase